MKLIYYGLLLSCLMQSMAYAMQDPNYWASQASPLMKGLISWLRPSINNPALIRQVPAVGVVEGYARSWIDVAASQTADTLVNKVRPEVISATNRGVEIVRQEGTIAKNAILTQYERLKEDGTDWLKKESTKLLVKVVGGALITIGAYFLAKYIWAKAEYHLTKPRLDFKIKSFDGLKEDEQKATPLTGLVFSQTTEEQLKEVIERTAYTKKQIQDGDQLSYYGGLLLCGPKNSGKQHFAENLARFVGMDFIELSASSLVHKYDEEKDLKIAYDDFFQHIASKTGAAIVFINNAELLLSNRKQTDATRLNRAITRFIDEAEKGRTKFMVILSVPTEKEKPLTDAMASIIKTSIMIQKPNMEERIRILTTNRNVIFGASDITNECGESALNVMNEQKIKEMAEKLAGATAAEVHKVVTDIRGVVKPAACLITDAIIDKIVQDNANEISKRMKNSI